MTRRPAAATRVGVRRITERWRRIGFAAAAVAVGQLGAYVAAPRLDVEVLRAAFVARRAAGGGLLALYDWLVGGALSRGAVVALGIVPYLTARIYLRLARLAFPRVDALAADDAGRATLARWTRALTVGLSLVQAYGFARFAQQVPGAVSHPGVGFVVRTMALLTAGAVLVTWLAEQAARSEDDDAPSAPGPSGHALTVPEVEAARAAALLSAGPLGDVAGAPSREPALVDRPTHPA